MCDHPYLVAESAVQLSGGPAWGGVPATRVQALLRADPMLTLGILSVLNGEQWRSILDGRAYRDLFDQLLVKVRKALGKYPIPVEHHAEDVAGDVLVRLLRWRVPACLPHRADAPGPLPAGLRLQPRPRRRPFYLAAQAARARDARRRGVIRRTNALGPASDAGPSRRFRCCGLNTLCTNGLHRAADRSRWRR